MNMEQAWLKPLAGGANVKVSGDVLIGRSEECDLVLKGGYPSRKHARLSLREGAARLEDLGSSNGTFVNGERILEPVSLNDGDRLRFDILEFDFVAAPVQTDRTQLRPAAAPAKPADEAAPAKPVERAGPAKPVDRAAPAEPADRPAPAKPVERAGPAKPVERAASAEPADRVAPAKPVEMVAPAKAADEAVPPSAPQARKPGWWVDPESQPEGGTKFLTREEIEKLRSETPAPGAEAKVDQPCLQVVSGLSRGKTLNLKGAEGQNEWRVGSEAGRDIVLGDEGVSGYHAKIVRVGGRWRLIDQMSQNGTRVNGRKASISYLSSGDRVRFGPVECVFQAPAAARQAGGRRIFWSLGIAMLIAIAVAAVVLWRWAG